MEISGVAHIQLTVNRIHECLAFYDQVMPYLGLHPVHRTDDGAYYVGGKTAVAISPSDGQYAHEEFVPMRIGLHHLCFRARSREDIDQLYNFLQEIRASIAYPPQEGPWAPGYYSVSFFDPDGIRLEVNHVPGKGLLAEGVAFDPALDHWPTGARN